MFLTLKMELSAAKLRIFYYILRATRGNLTILVKVCYDFGVIGVKMVGLMGQGWVMKSRT